MYKKWNTLRSIKNVWTGRTLLSIDIRVNLCPLYRFSAFWLRSKCSICSYQLNIWQGLLRRPRYQTDFSKGMRLKLCYLVAGWPGIAVPSGSAQLPTHTRRSSSSPSYHWRTISINTFKRSALFLQQTQYPEIPGGLSRGHYLALWCQITFSKGLHVNHYIQRCGKAPSLLHLLNENCSLHYMFLFIA